MKDKKLDKSLEELKTWSILIPRIEEILESNIRGKWKCVLIRYEIKEARKKESEK